MPTCSIDSSGALFTASGVMNNERTVPSGGVCERPEKELWHLGRKHMRLCERAWSALGSSKGTSGSESKGEVKGWLHDATHPITVQAVTFERKAR